MLFLDQHEGWNGNGNEIAWKRCSRKARYCYLSAGPTRGYQKHKPRNVHKTTGNVNVLVKFNERDGSQWLNQSDPINRELNDLCILLHNNW